MSHFDIRRVMHAVSYQKHELLPRSLPNLAKKAFLISDWDSNSDE